MLNQRPALLTAVYKNILNPEGFVIDQRESTLILKQRFYESRKLPIKLI